MINGMLMTEMKNSRLTTVSKCLSRVFDMRDKYLSLPIISTKFDYNIFNTFNYSEVQHSQSRSCIIQTLIQRHPPPLTRIVKPMQILPAHRLNLRESLITHHTFQRPKVLADPFFVLALGDHARPSTHAPRQRHRRRRAPALLRDIVDDRVLEQCRRGALLRASVGGVRIREWGVRRHVDTVVVMPLHPRGLLQVRVQLHLVSEGGNRGFGNQIV